MAATEAGSGRGALRRGGLTPRQLELLDRLKSLFLAEGFAHFTLEDLALRLRCSKTTLYTLAPSKEQLAVTVVNHYFKGATVAVEAEISGVADVRERIGGYLAGIGEEMRLASADFIADVDAFGPARDSYERNTRAAAERIRGFINEGIDAGVFRPAHAAFLAEMVGATIGAIQRRDVRRRTGLSDGEAFAQLSTFVLWALRPTDDSGTNGEARSGPRSRRRGGGTATGAASQGC